MNSLWDTFQGSIGTVSPAFGQYKQIIGWDLDIGITGVSGVTGAQTNLMHNFHSGITGIQGSNHTHANWMY